MNNKIKLFLSSILFTTILSACGGSEHHHDDVSYTTTTTTTYTTSSSNDEPRIYQFHMIDTYGTNTEFDELTELALSPVINQGLFEVFWEIDSGRDYFVELRVNTHPSSSGSRLISSEYCGPGLFCHDNQYQFCEYTNGLNIECENSSGEFQSNYVGDLLDTIPDDVYFILEVCDSGMFYCESDAIQVSME